MIITEILEARLVVIKLLRENPIDMENARKLEGKISMLKDLIKESKKEDEEFSKQKPRIIHISKA